MEPTPLTPEEEDRLEAIVARYRADSAGAELFRKVLHESLFSSAQLSRVVHSIRSRAKDPDHLKDKLWRKLNTAKKSRSEFDITPENLFEKINDLVGLRLLHLHTHQFPAIHEALLERLDEYKIPLKEGPIAHVWDSEYQGVFRGFNVQTAENKRMYTSVHYVVEENSRTKRTAEIQVRTLAEELWGEVDHSINYPHECSTVACVEQIRVLARMTSGCTRLVDSIYRTFEDGRGK